jgi:hypothetical protein
VSKLSHLPDPAPTEPDLLAHSVQLLSFAKVKIRKLNDFKCSITAKLQRCSST